MCPLPGFVSLAEVEIRQTVLGSQAQLILMDFLAQTARFTTLLLAVFAFLSLKEGQVWHFTVVLLHFDVLASRRVFGGILSQAKLCLRI